MIPTEQIAAFLEQASAQGSRSTVLRPLGWLLSICAAGLLGAVSLKAPLWVAILFATGTGLSIALYLAAYCFCPYKDRDALRSETYSIRKLAIEKGFIGDSLRGVVTVRGESEYKLITAPGAETPEEPK